eukprot:3197257-Rhodomonas_salina.3
MGAATWAGGNPPGVPCNCNCNRLVLKHNTVNNCAKGAEGGGSRNPCRDAVPRGTSCWYKPERKAPPSAVPGRLRSGTEPFEKLTKVAKWRPVFQEWVTNSKPAVLTPEFGKLASQCLISGHSEQYPGTRVPYRVGYPVLVE